MEVSGWDRKAARRIQPCHVSVGRRGEWRGVSRRWDSSPLSVSSGRWGGLLGTVHFRRRRKVGEDGLAGRRSAGRVSGRRGPLNVESLGARLGRGRRRVAVVRLGGSDPAWAPGLLPGLAHLGLGSWGLGGPGQGLGPPPRFSVGVVCLGGLGPTCVLRNIQLRGGTGAHPAPVGWFRGFPIAEPRSLETTGPRGKSLGPNGCRRKVPVRGCLQNPRERGPGNFEKA